MLVLKILALAVVAFFIGIAWWAAYTDWRDEQEPWG